jgi:8-amino-7-oxononanoate synthase
LITAFQPQDAFEKARKFNRAEEAHAAGLYPYFKAIEHHHGGSVIVDGEEYVLTGSNDYLGLTQDERIKQAARDAVETYGTSCTGSRFLTGTLDIHETLEHELAEFFGKEQVLVFAAGFLACASSAKTMPACTMVLNLPTCATNNCAVLITTMPKILNAC